MIRRSLKITKGLEVTWMRLEIRRSTPRGVCFVTMKSQYDAGGKWKGKYEEVKGTVVTIVRTRYELETEKEKKREGASSSDWWSRQEMVPVMSLNTSNESRRFRQLFVRLCIAFDSLFCRNYENIPRFRCSTYKTNVKGIDNLSICKTRGKLKR